MTVAINVKHPAEGGKLEWTDSRESLGEREAVCLRVTPHSCPWALSALLLQLAPWLTGDGRGNGLKERIKGWILKIFFPVLIFFIEV